MLCFVLVAEVCFFLIVLAALIRAAEEKLEGKLAKYDAIELLQSFDRLGTKHVDRSSIGVLFVVPPVFLFIGGQRMALMMPSLEVPPSPSVGRSKPRLLIRGRRRTAIRHLMEKLKVMQNQDAAEAARATLLGYNPTLFKDGEGSADDRALKRCIKRCIDLLAMTA